MKIIINNPFKKKGLIMKFIAIIALGLSILSCSKNDINLNKEDVLEFNLKSANISPDPLQIGDVEFQKNKLMTFIIENNGDEILEGPVGIVGDGYSILNQIGCEYIKVKNTCIVKVFFNGKNLNAGIKNANLALNENVSFNLSLNMKEEKIENLEESISVSTEILDFGTLTQKQSVLKNVIITNTSKKTLNKEITISSPWTIASDGCSNKNLAPKKTCVVKVLLSGSSTPDGGNISGVLSYGLLSPTVELLANIQTENQTGQLGNVIALYNNIEVTEQNPANLGDIKQGGTVIINIFLKNIGVASTPISNINFSEPIRLISTTCSASLGVNRTCFVKGLFSPVEQQNESLNVTVAGVNKSFPIIYNLLGN